MVSLLHFFCLIDLESLSYLEYSPVTLFISLVNLPGSSQQHFEEQQYADLSEFQENHYGALDTKLALWHDYEYVDQAKIREKLMKKDSIISTTGYEYIDSILVPLKSGNVDPV